MGKRPTRDSIVHAADALFYQKGFDHTSFADIAAAVNISRGNFYYHFQSKDEILTAVIQERTTDTQAMLDMWDAAGETPAERIRSFIRILLVNQDKIKQFGCPVGSMFTELAKLQHSAQDDARALFSLFRGWLRDQFIQLGHREQADALAMHILARSQGVATLASAFPDEAFLQQEVAQMEAWLDACLETTDRAVTTPLEP